MGLEPVHFNMLHLSSLAMPRQLRPHTHSMREPCRTLSLHYQHPLLAVSWCHPITTSGRTTTIAVLPHSDRPGHWPRLAPTGWDCEPKTTSNLASSYPSTVLARPPCPTSPHQLQPLERSGPPAWSVQHRTGRTADYRHASPCTAPSSFPTFVRYEQGSNISY